MLSRNTKLYFDDVNMRITAREKNNVNFLPKVKSIFTIRGPAFAWFVNFVLNTRKK